MIKMITRTTTYDDLEALMGEFKKKNIIAGDYMVSEKEINDIIIPNYEQYEDFVYWLLETSTPITEEAKNNKRLLMNIFFENTQIGLDTCDTIVIKFNAEKYEDFLRFLENK